MRENLEEDWGEHRFAIARLGPVFPSLKFNSGDGMFPLPGGAKSHCSKPCALLRRG
jgi:hypothetical protein